MSESHFIWRGSRVLVEAGPFELPFEVSLFGLILSVVLFYFGYEYLRKRLNPELGSKSKRKRQKKTENMQEPSGLVVLGIGLASLLIGQLVFAVIPSPGFQVVGPLVVHWYGVLFASAFLIGYALGSASFRHAGFPQKDADSLLTYLFIGTIAGARLGEVLFYNPGYYLMNLHEIPMIWRGGLASHGALIGNILAMWLYVRKRPHITYFWVLDRMTLPFSLGGVFVRIGNFFNSEIYGHPTDVSWAVAFPNASDLQQASVELQMAPRHPSMLYEAVNGLLVFGLLFFVYKKWNHRPPAGAMLGLYLVLIFIGRFLIEYTKVEQADFAVNWMVGMGQLLSIPVVAIGLYILLKKVNWTKPEQTNT